MRRKCSQFLWRIVLGSLLVGPWAKRCEADTSGYTLGDPCLNCGDSASGDGLYSLSFGLVTIDPKGPLIGASYSLEGLLTPLLISEFRVSGEVRYYVGTSKVPGVQLVADGDTSRASTTGSDGVFSMPLIGGSDHTITPSKLVEQPPSQGVTTLDITLLRRHILAIARLDSPYKLLAGDVNRSGSVSTLDITLMRRVILGISSTYPAGLWSFVAASHVFSDPTAPFGVDASRHYTLLAADQQGQDFLGIKLGDVNGSWTPPVVAPPPPPTQTNPAQGVPSFEVSNLQTGTAHPGQKSVSGTALLSVGEVVSVAPGEFEVPLRVSAVGAMTSLQFGLSWNPEVFEWVDLATYGLRGFGQANLNLQHTSVGELGFSWDDPEALGVSAVEGLEFMKLKFRCRNSVPSGGVIGFTSGSIPAELSSSFAGVPTRWQEGWIWIGRTPGIPGMLLPSIAGDSVQIDVPTWVGLKSVIETAESLNSPLWRIVESIEGDGTVKPVTARVSAHGQGYYRARFVP